MLTRLRRDQRGDRGSVAVWIVIFTFAVMVLLTFVVDGGQLMNAKERAADIAEQAARATVGDIDITALRSRHNGHISISADACTAGGPAASLVADYARGTGVSADIPAIYHGRPGCWTGTVLTSRGVQHFATVTVEITTRPVIPFGIFGSYQVPATQTALLDCGIAQGVPC
jgi:Flp pilus assembly protein TadG